MIWLKKPKSSKRKRTIRSLSLLFIYRVVFKSLNWKPNSFWPQIKKKFLRPKWKRKSIEQLRYMVSFCCPGFERPQPQGLLSYSLIQFGIVFAFHKFPLIYPPRFFCEKNWAGHFDELPLPAQERHGSALPQFLEFKLHWNTHGKSEWLKKSLLLPQGKPHRDWRRKAQQLCLRNWAEAAEGYPGWITGAFLH